MQQLNIVMNDIIVIDTCERCIENKHFIRFILPENNAIGVFSSSSFVR